MICIISNDTIYIDQKYSVSIRAKETHQKTHRRQLNFLGTKKERKKERKKGKQNLEEKRRLVGIAMVSG